MPPKSVRLGLTPLEDRTVPSVTPEQLHGALAQADLQQDHLQALVEKKVEFMNVYMIADLKTSLRTVTTDSQESDRILSEYQNQINEQAQSDPSLGGLVGYIAQERYKAEVNAVTAASLTTAVGGTAVTGVAAPVPADQPIPPTPVPVPVPPPSPPVVTPAPVDTTTNAGTTGVLPDLTQPGFKDLGDGVRVNDVVVGQGDAAKAGQDVNVFYTGFLKDGTVFDGNRDKGPTNFNLNQVVKGFNEGVQGMQPGGVRQIFIPSALGYGAAGSGSSIPPNSDIIFEVKLLSATDPTSTTPAS